MGDKLSEEASSFLPLAIPKIEPDNDMMYESAGCHGVTVPVVTETVMSQYKYQHDLLQHYAGTDVDTSQGVIASSFTESNDTVDDSKSEINIGTDVACDDNIKDDGLDDQVSITIEFSEDSNGMLFESQDNVNNGTEGLQLNTNGEKTETNMDVSADYLLQNSEIKLEYSDIVDNTAQNITDHATVVACKNMFTPPATGSGINQQANLDVPKELEAEEEKIWHCVSCGRCFGTKKVLDEHLQCHDNKLYFCTQKTYGTLKPNAIIGNEELDNSAAAISTDGRSCYDCEERMKVFSKERIQELSNKIRSCSFCGKIFDGMASVRRHESLHKVKDPTQIKRYKSTCGNCGRKYSSIANCHRHVIEMHAGSSGSKFECPHCQRFVRRYSDAVQHINIHHPRFRVQSLAGKIKVAMNSNSCSAVPPKAANNIISVTAPVSVKLPAPLPDPEPFTKAVTLSAPKGKKKRRRLTLRRRRFTLNSKTNYTGISTRRSVSQIPCHQEDKELTDIPSADIMPEPQTHSPFKRKSDITSSIPRTNDTLSAVNTPSLIPASSALNEAKTVTSSSTLGQPLEYLCRRSDNGIVIEISREIITRVIIQMEDGTKHEEEFHRPL